MTIHVTPIPSTIALGVPGFTLGGTNAAGTSGIAVASDSTLSSVFSANVDLGSNKLVGNAGSTGIAVSAQGEVTMAAQPAVLYRLTAGESNVTGNSTIWLSSTGTSNWTEIFDQNGDFDGDGTFTAPVDGKYLIAFSIECSGVTPAADNLNIRIVSTKRTIITWRVTDVSSGFMGTTDGGIFSSSMLIDMDATDTARIGLQVVGEGSDVVDVDSAHTYFSACMLV